MESSPERMKIHIEALEASKISTTLNLELYDLATYSKKELRSISSDTTTNFRQL